MKLRNIFIFIRLHLLAQPFHHAFYLKPREFRIEIDLRKNQDSPFAGELQVEMNENKSKRNRARKRLEVLEGISIMNVKGMGRACELPRESEILMKTKLTIKRSIAVVCALAVWFSMGVGSNVKAAQAMPDASAVTAPVGAVDAEVGAAQVQQPVNFVFETPTLITVALITATFLIGYNVFTSGKHGWGWLTICIIAGMVAVFLRLGVSMFREIASASVGSVNDWDSE
ncbi:MAG: hypothetical protein AB8B55_06100 [Mariniblastus sp.]